jgi:hypothetical protein
MTYYTDGALGLALVLLLLSLLSLRIGETQRTCDSCILTYIFTSIVIAVNIKFTGLFYAGIFLAAFGIYYWITRRGSTIDLKKVTLVALAGIILSLLLGFNPYYTNLRDYGSPFYPLMGNGAVDILACNQPTVFTDMPTWKQATTSFMAQSKAWDNDGGLVLKVPGVFKWKELTYFSEPDVRIGGFGPLFSLVALLALMLWLIRFRRFPFPVSAALLLLIAFFLFSPGAWWARYFAVLAAFPVLIAVTVLARQPETKFAQSSLGDRALRVVSWGILVGILLNTALCSIYPINRAITFTKAEATELQYIASHGKSIRVHFDNPLFAQRAKFDDIGVQYKLTAARDKKMTVLPTMQISVGFDTPNVGH